MILIYDTIMNMAKNFKYLLIFFLINILLLDQISALFFMISVIHNVKLMAIKTILALPYMCFVIVNKFYLLPLICYFTINYSHQQNIVKFFLKWKSSLKRQILYLGIIFIVMPILYTLLSLSKLEKYSLYELFKTYFDLNLKMGLYQAYLILYFYWFIEYIFENNNYLKSFKQNKIMPLIQDFFILMKCLNIKSVLDFIKRHWLFIIIIIILIREVIIR